MPPFFISLKEKIMKEKVTHITQVPQEKVEMEGVKDAYIQWLISDKDGAPNFAMRRFVVKAGGYTPYHHHPYEHEVLVLSGQGQVKIGESIYNLHSGSVVFVPPDVMHQFRNTGDTDLEFICVIPNQPKK